MSQVTLRNVVKKYGKVKVIHNIDLDIRKNEFIVLVGPSGCGKSTTLRMIAGLESISGGTIEIGDRVVNDVPPKFRNIAMVFQDYALYPHMTVYENMAFSLKMKKTPPHEIKKKVNEAAQILGIEDFLKRKPQALSGGQRQRVAMGRAIVRDPEVFLFDEPLSNLDAKLRTQMRMELKKLHMTLKTTTVYVTHDQVEAMTLADRIVIMKDGVIHQIGTPAEVYEQPVDQFVAGFIGNPSMNMVPARLTQTDGTYTATAKDLALRLPARLNGNANGLSDVVLGVRPESIVPVSETKEKNSFEGRVIVSEITGSTSLLEINLSGIELMAEVEGRNITGSGEKRFFSIDAEQVHLFDPETGRRI